MCYRRAQTEGSLGRGEAGQRPARSARGVRVRSNAELESLGAAVFGVSVSERRSVKRACDGGRRNGEIAPSESVATSESVAAEVTPMITRFQVHL